MKTEIIRLCIYPKDVQRITGLSYRQSVRYIHRMRAALNKSETELLSVEEFCHYTGLKYKQVSEHLRD